MASNTEIAVIAGLLGGGAVGLAILSRQNPAPQPSSSPPPSSSSSPPPSSSSSSSSSAPPSSGATYAQDTFQRPAVVGSWGDATDGLAWSTFAGDGTIDTTGAAGEIKSNVSVSDFLALGGQVSSADTETLVRFSLSTVGQGEYHSDFCYAFARNLNDYYAAGLDAGTQQVGVLKQVSGTQSTLATFPMPVTPGQFYWLRFLVQGNTLSARVWADGSAEPTSWQVQVVDTDVTTAGYAGIVGWGASTPGVTVTYFDVFAPGAVGSSSSPLPPSSSSSSSSSPPASSSSSSTSPPSSSTSPPPSPMPVVSWGQPVYASAGSPGNASGLNNGLAWQPGSTSGWIAYDLSSVPASQRGKSVVAWSSQNSGSYGYTFASLAGVCQGWEGGYPTSYTIDVNAAPGGSVPTSGWVSLVTVTDNAYKSRQHLIDLTGYNWVRLTVVSTTNPTSNPNPNISLDTVLVCDASTGVATDDYVFLGDSIMALCMDAVNATDQNGNTIPSFALSIYQGTSGADFPVYEDAGLPCVRADQVSTFIDTLLAMYPPGTRICITLGTNDAWNGQGDPATYQGAMETIVQAIIAAQMIPVISTIPWPNTTAAWQANVASLNAVLPAIFSAYPECVTGPDFYSFFQANPSLITSGDVHPTTAGQGAFRSLWASVMLMDYAGSSSPPPSSTTSTSSSVASSSPPPSSSSSSSSSVPPPSSSSSSTPGAGFVQSTSIEGSSLILSDVAEGDRLILAVSSNGTAPTGITDSQSNSWELADPTQGSVVYGNGTGQVWIATAGASGALTVTATGGGALAMVLSEYTGVGAVDQVLGAVTGGSTLSVGPTPALQVTGELVVVAGGQTNVGAGFTAGSGFTLRDSAVENYLSCVALEDAVSATSDGVTGTIGVPSATAVGNGYAWAIVATFLPVAG